MDVTEASEPHAISNIIPKMCVPELVGPLASLFRIYFVAAKFSKAWKAAHLVFVPEEDGDLTNVGFYRSISFLSCVGEVYDNIINKTLYQYLESHRIIADT